jgi:hypothetical protein
MHLIFFCLSNESCTEMEASLKQPIPVFFSLSITATLGDLEEFLQADSTNAFHMHEILSSNYRIALSPYISTVMCIPTPQPFVSCLPSDCSCIAVSSPCLVGLYTVTFIQWTDDGLVRIYIETFQYFSQGYESNLLKSFDLSLLDYTI